MSTDANKRDAASVSGYLRYGVILGLLGAIRLLEAAIANSSWRIVPGDASPRMLWGLCALAFVVSLATCLYSRTRVSKVTAVLLSALTGGTATLVMSSFFGMGIGAVVGGLTAFDMTQRLSLKALKFMASLIFPAALIGIATGYFGARWGWLNVDLGAEFHTATWIFGLLLMSSMVVAGLIVWLKKEHVIHLLWKFPIFLLVALTAEPLGIDMDTARRLRRLSQEFVFVYAIPTGGAPVVPLWYQSLVRGNVLPTDVQIENGLTKEQGRLLDRFPTVKQVIVSENPDRDDTFNAGGFSEADFRGVTRMQVISTGFNDQAMLGLQNCDKMFEFLVSAWRGSAEITDEGLASLRNMTMLTNLNLDGQNIEGSGLRHLHPDAPLQYLSLRNTNVNDHALKHLANHDVGVLTLAGTRVTGTGLADFVPKTTMGLSTVDLSRAPVDEKNFALFPKSLLNLRLDGTSVTRAGAIQLANLPSLESLAIPDSGIDDQATHELASCGLKHLEIDAAKLTAESCSTLAKVPVLELQYEAEPWLSSGRDLKDLVEHYEDLKNEIDRQRNQLPASKRLGSTRLAIRNLVVKQDMVEFLMNMKDYSLESANISEGAAFLKDEQPVQDVDPDDLHRWFPPQTLVQEKEADEEEHY